MFVGGLRDITVGFSTKEKRKEYCDKNRDRLNRQQREWRKRNIGKEKEYKRRWYLKSRSPEQLEKEKWAMIRYRYGLEKEDYERILEDQDNKCKICDKEFDSNGQCTKLHIDHCHDSDEVRGFLCNNCNIGLGYFRDDPKILQSAAEYLT